MLHIFCVADQGHSSRLIASLQKRFGFGFTALGLFALIPGLASNPAKKGVVAGRKGQALPTLGFSLHQSSSTVVLGGPSGINADDAGAVTLIGLVVHPKPWD